MVFHNKCENLLYTLPNFKCLIMSPTTMDPQIHHFSFTSRQYLEATDVIQLLTPVTCWLFPC